MAARFAMEVESVQQHPLHQDVTSNTNLDSNTMEASMDIDMDIDLGPLPEAEPIEMVGVSSELELSRSLLADLDRGLGVRYRDIRRSGGRRRSSGRGSAARESPYQRCR